MTQAEFTFLWLHTPAVTLRSEEERLQSWTAKVHDLVTRGVSNPQAERIVGPPPKPRTPEERAALLAKLARRASRPGYLRTDPWAGIDRNPWRITEAERKRLGLGRW